MVAARRAREAHRGLITISSPDSGDFKRECKHHSNEMTPTALSTDQRLDKNLSIQSAQNNGDSLDLLGLDDDTLSVSLQLTNVTFRGYRQL